MKIIYGVCGGRIGGFGRELGRIASEENPNFINFISL